METLGEEDPVPLSDVWPGLAPHLSGQARTCHLIRCQQLGAADASGRACVRVDSSIYLAGTGDEHRDLHLVSRELGLDLEDHELQAILQYVTPQQVLAERAAIRELPTDAERLLHAVGENALRAGLPDSLVAVLESRSTPLTGTKLAEAAIATYHTSALKQYRWALEHFAPPGRWAGSARAVEFVQSLGFSAERASIAPDWPTLIFATSVEHAQTVAGLLNANDVTARAVSGSTETVVRRDVVEMFRAGRINVLVNYGVFREGFDAPRTRAILVARPVYSPNLYFQMIGRGLRGPKNGGNDRCLIVNVRDNIENFNRQLAFSDLDWLWGSP